MALPTVKINNSTGSDTAASGAGPTTAVFGTAASFVTTLVTLDGSPDLSGVATDGSHLLWLLTSTGRQYFTINAVDDTLNTVTVDDAPAGTSTGRTWGIGGKRATLDHANTRTLAVDVKAGWTVDIEETGTNYTWTSNAPSWNGGSLTAGVVTLMSSSSARPIIAPGTVSTAALRMNNYTHVRHLRFLGPTGGSTATETIDFPTIAEGNSVEDCYLDGSGSVRNGIFWGGNPSLIGGLVQGNYFTGYTESAGGAILVADEGGVSGRGLVIVGNYFVGNDTAIEVARMYGVVIVDNLIVDNLSHGIHLPDTSGDGEHAGRGYVIAGNTIHSNDGDGIRLEATRALQGSAIFNNQITSNGGFGINLTVSDLLQGLAFIDHNNVWNNTSGARNNLNAGANDLALDPGYVNAAGGNYAIGTATKAAGYPKASDFIGITSATRTFVDIGAAQREEPVLGSITRGIRVL